MVLASHNIGKLKEISGLLSPLGIDVVSAGSLGLSDPPETEDSFEGNARLKAHFATGETGLVALSDDSGIEVEALDGAPGVYTADWAETPGGRDFEMAMSRVWQELDERQAPEPRLARFVCCLCLAWPDGHDEIFRGKVEGHLVWPLRGTNGFGFDPMFVPDGGTKTFGEMTPDRKKSMSHRTRAFKQMMAGCFAG